MSINYKDNTQDVLANLHKIGMPKNMLFLCYRGSISQNTYISKTDPYGTSDTDLLGVFLSPPEYYIGLSQHKLINPTTVEIKQEVDGVLLDCVFYELRHFISMALKSNPNVFSALWVKPEHQIILHDQFEPYLDNRKIFLSKHSIYKAFTGYANGQLKRMTAWNRQGYMGEKRKRLVEKFGYDTKNASCLIRLLHMGIEVLQTGDVKVFRDVDADIFTDIKLGDWELDEIKRYAEELFHEAGKAYEVSTLPEEPDTKMAECILMQTLYTHLNRSMI